MWKFSCGLWEMLFGGNAAPVIRGGDVSYVSNQSKKRKSASGCKMSYNRVHQGARCHIITSPCVMSSSIRAPQVARKDSLSLWYPSYPNICGKKSGHGVELDFCALGMYHRHFSPWKQHMKHLHEACSITLSSAQLMLSLTAMTWGKWKIARKLSHFSLSYSMLLLASEAIRLSTIPSSASVLRGKV